MTFAKQVTFKMMGSLGVDPVPGELLQHSEPDESDAAGVWQPGDDDLEHHDGGDAHHQSAVWAGAEPRISGGRLSFRGGLSSRGAAGEWGLEPVAGSWELGGSGACSL